MNAKRATLATAGTTLLVVGGLPVCFMILSSFRMDGSWSLINYAGTLGHVNTWKLFGNSIVLAALTTAIAGLLGVGLGILLARTDVPWSNCLAGLLAAPLLFPPYIFAVGWFEVLGRQGVLSRWIGQEIGEFTSPLLFSLPGASLILAWTFLPIVLLPTMGYLRGINPSMEEAARLSLAWPAVLRRITVPLVLPGVLLALILVFLLSMGEFGAPAFLRVEVFPVASFTQSSAFYNSGAATAAAMPLLAVVLAGLFVAEKVLYGRQYAFRWGSRDDAPRILLGRKRYAAFALTVALAVIFALTPLLGLVLRGLSPSVLSDAIERAGSSTFRSVVYAAITATVLSVIGLFLGYIIDRRSLTTWRLLDASALFLFTLPGSVVGIGMIALWNRQSTNWIYATPVILALGFIAQYAALSARIIGAGLSQIPSSLEEAAEVAGAGWFRRLWGILAPVNRRALLVAWIITFIFCLRDVPLPLLLAPPGGDTLTGRTMTLMANGSAELIAGLCILSILVALLPLGAAGAAWCMWRKVA